MFVEEHEYGLIAVPRPWVPEWLWSWFSAVSGAWPLPWLVVRQPLKWVFTTKPQALTTTRGAGIG